MLSSGNSFARAVSSRNIWNTLANAAFCQRKLLFSDLVPAIAIGEPL